MITDRRDSQAEPLITGDDESVEVYDPNAPKETEGEDDDDEETEDEEETFGKGLISNIQSFGHSILDAVGTDEVQLVFKLLSGDVMLWVVIPCKVSI